MAAQSIPLRLARVVSAVAFLCCTLGYPAQGLTEPRIGHAAICQSLAGSGEFSWTTVTSSVWKPAGRTVPAFCEVTGVISAAAGSRIGVVYRLPEQWSGRLVGLGGGGWAGNLRLKGPLGALVGLERGDATAQTDAGHVSTAVWNTSWAMLPDGRTNWPGMVDFSYRAIHLMTVIGKQVVRKFYGVRPSESYFDGCSTGGRQALMEAQRFPGDYTGIIAGAPVYNEWTETSMVNSGRVFGPATSKLTPAEIELVNRAVLKSCDRQDGLKDGIITNRQACHWDPAPLLCKHEQAADTCLTSKQVEAVRSAYRPVHTPGGAVAAFGLARGSELISFPIFVSWGDHVPEVVGLENVRAAQFGNSRFNFDTWNIGRQFEKMRRTRFARMYDAGDPDLASFVGKGGKLMIWQGLYDQFPRAPATAAYFVRMRKLIATQLVKDGRPARLVDQSVRLYMLPGVGHCSGGPGADSFDKLALMEAWVEKGRVPDEAPVSKRSKRGAVLFTRPLCPYPALPYYVGRGNPRDATSFVCRRSGARLEIRNVEANSPALNR